MARTSSTSPKGRILALVGAIPPGRVATIEAIAREAGLVPHHVISVLSSLSEDEREMCPWHRAVAKGGAIGRGPWREAQFARLMREGLSVSPAGIVQDMARVALSEFLAPEGPVAEPFSPPPKLHRSRGMKQRPGS